MRFLGERLSISSPILGEFVPNSGVFMRSRGEVPLDSIDPDSEGGDGSAMRSDFSEKQRTNQSPPTCTRAILSLQNITYGIVSGEERANNIPKKTWCQRPSRQQLLTCHRDFVFVGQPTQAHSH